MPLHVLHHHDGIIDHETDRKNHRQQGQQIDSKAEHLHQKDAADNETGMATTGTKTDLKEPRKRKMTITTMSRVSSKSLHYLMNSIDDIIGSIIGYPRCMPRGNSFCIDAISAVTRLITSTELALGSGQMPINTADWPEKCTSAP